MASLALPVHRGLAAGTRLPGLARPGLSAELGGWICLLGMGMLAGAAMLYLRLRLGVPGHAILRIVVPLTLGMALVPRYLSGSVMSVTGFLWLLACSTLGQGGVGIPAMTSLLLTGPTMDAATVGAKPGVWLYVRMALAGLVANLLALSSRGVVAALGFSVEGGGRADKLGWVTVVSYAGCGLAAGLLCAALCFRLRSSWPEAPR